jgi:RNA polymerase sigma-70 factor (ECF subfamily)
MDADELLAHGAFLRALARGLLRGEGAEDVVQEAYARALERRPRQPRAWLGRVVRNLALTSRIGSGRRARRERAAARAEAEPAAADAVARLEIQRLVVDAVLALREPYRSTVVQRYFEGLKTKEIARRTGVPYETVRTRLGRALAELRKELDRVHHGWALALAPLVPRPAFPLGGLLVTAKKKALLLVLPLVGIAAGAIGHAIYAPAPAAARGPAETPGRVAELDAALDAARQRIAALEAENAALREPAREPAAAGPVTIDWSELLPLLRAVARADPNRAQRLDAGEEQRLHDLLQEINELGLVRDGMQVQDLWRLPAVGSGIALAFAREGGTRIDDAVGDGIRAAMEAIEAELPGDPLDIELLAAAEEQLAATEEILARASSPAAARQAVAELVPLWRRRHWQTLRFGAMTKEALGELVAGMVDDAPADARARVLETTGRMADEFRRVRADLAREHGEETLRAVLLEPGTAGADEAVLAQRRLRDDYPTVERRIRAAAARHQARFEREYYRLLPPAAQEDYARIAATLLLFDLEE